MRDDIIIELSDEPAGTSRAAAARGGPGRRFEAQHRVLDDPRRPTLAALAAGTGDWPFSSGVGATLPDPEAVLMLHVLNTVSYV